MSIQLELGFNDAPLTRGLSAAQARLNELQSQITQLNSVISNTTSQETLRRALTALGEKQKEVKTITNGLKGSIKELADESVKAAEKINNIPKSKLEGFKITSAVKTAGGDEISAIQLRVNQYTASIERLNKVIGETKSQTQLTNALAALSQRQSELNKLTRLSTGALESDNVKKAQSAKINNQAAFTLNNFNRVIQDAPYGLRGVANNIDPLIESFRNLASSTKNAGGPIAALRGALTSGAGLAIAVSTVTSLLVVFSDKLFDNSSATDKAAESAKKYADDISNVVRQLNAERDAINQIASGQSSLTKIREKNVEFTFGQGTSTDIQNLKSRISQTVTALRLNRDQQAKILKDENDLYDAYVNKKTTVYNDVALTEEQYNEKLKALRSERFKLQSDEIKFTEQLLEQRVDLRLLNQKNEREINEKSKQDYEKYVKSIIEQAKKIADFTEKTIDLRLGITPLDTEREAFEKAKKFLDAYKKGLFKYTPFQGILPFEYPAELKIKPPTKAELDEQLRLEEARRFLIILPSLDEARTNETLGNLRNRIIEATTPKEKPKTDIFGNIIKDVKTINDLLKTTEGVSKLNDYIREIDEIKKAYKELGLVAPNIELSGPIFAVDEAIKDVKYNLKGLKEDFTTFNQSIQQEFQVLSKVFGDILTPAFDSFFQAFEQGKDPVQAFFQGFADGVKRLIQEMIRLAAISGIISLASGGSISFTQAFGQLTGFGGNRRNNALANLNLSGLRGRALGGPVSGNTPYLVGERGPELFVPSVSGGIVPNNFIGGFMGGGMGSTGGRSSVLRGQDILLAYARTQRSQLRVNG